MAKTIAKSKATKPKSGFTKRYRRFQETRYDIKDRKLKYKAKKENLPSTKYRREQLSKQYSRAHQLAILGAATAPLHQYIAQTADDREKIELARIEKEIMNAKTSAELVRAQTKLEDLLNSMKNKGEPNSERSSVRTAVDALKAKGASIITSGFNEATPSSTDRIWHTINSGGK